MWMHLVVAKTRLLIVTIQKIQSWPFGVKRLAGYATLIVLQFLESKYLMNGVKTIALVESIQHAKNPLASISNVSVRIRHQNVKKRESYAQQTDLASYIVVKKA